MSLLSLVSYYVVIVRGAAYDFNAGVPAPAIFSLLFVFCGIASLPGLHRFIGLRRGEMLTVYAMLMAGGPMVSWGTLAWMLPHSVIQRYMAGALPDWEKTLVHLIPQWFSPSDPAAVQSFFLGQASVPWALWWKPLAASTSFMVGLLAAEWCLLALLQQQWIRHERLSFPLAQIPLYVIQEKRGGRGTTGLPVALVFWAGVLGSFGLGLMRQVSAWYPSIPTIPESVVLVGYEAVGPRAGLGEIALLLSPWMVAIAYLIPKELSFSCWLFWWVRVGLTVVAISFGAEPLRPEDWFGSFFPAPAWQGVGSLVALGAWTAWIGRRHLGHALRTAITGRPAGGDATEPMPYRAAVIGFVLALLSLTALCWAAGCRAWVALVFVTAIVLYHVVWARVFSYLNQPTSLDANALAGALGGAAATLILGILRLRFWWFPLHPIGYLAANTYALSYLWSSFVIGWLAKTLVTRYGGLRLYRHTLPLAVGLIAGDLLNVTLWACVNALVRGGA